MVTVIDQIRDDITDRERGQMAPRELWSAMASHYRVHRTAPEYQRPCDYLKWYEKQSRALAAL